MYNLASQKTNHGYACCLAETSGVSKVGHGRAFALPTAAESNFNTALKPFK